MINIGKDKMKFEEFVKHYFLVQKSNTAIKKIKILVDDSIIVLKKYIGCGAYNVVFYADYYKNSICKPVIFKLFIPRRFDNETDFEYELEIFDKDDICELISLRVLPKQFEKYQIKKDEYVRKNKEIYNLLKHECVNSYIPKSYEEKIFYGSNDTDNEILNNFLLFEYDAYQNLDDYFINSNSLVERLKIVKSLSNIVGELYYNPKIRMLLIDIKPENFLYKSNEKVEDSLYKVLDWDSIIEFDKNYKIKGAPNLHYTDTYSPNEIIKANSIDKIDIRTAIFMLSVVLYRAIFRNAIMNKKIPPFPLAPASRFTKVRFDEFAMKAELNNMIMIDRKTGAADGFLLKFKEIMNKAYTNNLADRYIKRENSNEIECFSEDIQSLIEIYENKGVHPEVMLNKAIAVAKNITNEDIDEDLFTSIKEMDDEN